jgi:hypothetical protein
MQPMIRKQIYILKRQQVVLRRLARALRVSEAELIRQAIDQRVRGDATRPLPADAEAWAKALAFMRALAAQGPLPERARTWRRDDLYEDV